MLVECLIHLLNWWRVRKVSKTIQIKFIVLAVSNKFRQNYGSFSKLGLLFMLKLIWKRLKVIKKNFKINYVLLFRNSRASVTGLKYLSQHCKICILLMLQSSAPTLYCFRNHNIHMLSWMRVSKIILDDCRDESWFQGNEGLGFVDRSTEFKASWWGVLLYASQNNAAYLLSLTFPPLLEIPKIQDQLLGSEQYERREKSYSSTEEVTL